MRGFVLANTMNEGLHQTRRLLVVEHFLSDQHVKPDYAADDLAGEAQVDALPDISTLRSALENRQGDVRTAWDELVADDLRYRSVRLRLRDDARQCQPGGGLPVELERSPHEQC